MDSYIINGRFQIKPDRNEINEVKVEPRIMKLLCLLIENKGKLVSRSYITELIWEGYGGGDEGLTQAISLLRKIFEDSNRTIIETIPKGGYIFNGAVSTGHTGEKAAINFPGIKTISIKPKYAAAAGLILIVLFGYMSNQKTGEPKNPAPEYSLEGIGIKHDSLHAFKHAANKNNYTKKK